jgi:hypothetical protein
VVAARERDVFSLVSQLKRYGIDATAFTRRHHVDVEAPVSVATFVYAGANLLSPDLQDVVIALDGVEAIGKRPTFCVEHFTNARMYGLLPLGRELSPYENDWIHALFGFREFVLPRPGHVTRDVQVVWTAGDGRRLTRSAPDLLSIKRHAVWRDDCRNRKVARIARAFAAGDRESLQHLLPSLPQTRLPPGPTNVCLLVENVEHAAALMSKLPDWPLVASVVPDMRGFPFVPGHGSLDGLPREQRSAVEARLVSPLVLSLERSIATHVGLGHWCLRKELSVLIRADAGVGLPWLPGEFLIRSFAGVPCSPLLVVDLEDSREPELRRRVQKRRAAYAKAGWGPPNLTRDQFLARVFLCRRWRRR